MRKRKERGIRLSVLFLSISLILSMSQAGIAFALENETEGQTPVQTGTEEPAVTTETPLGEQAEGSETTETTNPAEPGGEGTQTGEPTDPDNPDNPDNPGTPDTPDTPDPTPTPTPTPEKVKPGLNYTKKNVELKASFRLKLTGVKASYKAKSSNTSIAKVKKVKKNVWKVYGKKKGTATITVKYKKKTYKCKVKVTPYIVPKDAYVWYCHRGYAAKYPENSLIALEKGMQAGFYGINWDIWPTKPNKKGNFDFVLTHDNELNSMTAKTWLVTKTVISKIIKLKITKGKNAKKSKQKIARFKDALAITKKYGGISQIEMKGIWTRKQTDLLAKKIRDSGMMDQVQVESLEEKSLIRFKKSLKKYKIKVATNLVSGLHDNPLTTAKLCVKYGFTNMPTRWERMNWKAVKYCRKHGIGIAAYVPVDQDSNFAAHELLKYKLDWIVTPGKGWYNG